MLYKLMGQQNHAAYDGIICDLTDFPVGYRRSGELRGFYRRVFDLSAVVLKDNGWFSMYAGSGYAHRLAGTEFPRSGVPRGIHPLF
jgi:hypothetical protein